MTARKLPQYVMPKRIADVEVSRSPRGVHVEVHGSRWVFDAQGRSKLVVDSSITSMSPAQARRLAKLLLKLASVRLARRVS